MQERERSNFVRVSVTEVIRMMRVKLVDDKGSLVDRIKVYIIGVNVNTAKAVET